MEELEKLKKRTKKLKIIFIFLLLLGVMCFAIIFIAEYYPPKSNSYNHRSAESQKVELFNSKYSPYMGKKRSESDVRQLITLVKNNNESDKEHQIEFTGITNSSKISKDDKYTIECDYSDDEFINKIYVIKEN